jgi:hypothetical protein
VNDAGGRVWLRRATKRAPLDFKGLGNGRKRRPRRGFPRTRGRAGPGSSMCGRCDLANKPLLATYIRPKRPRNGVLFSLHRTPARPCARPKPHRASGPIRKTASELGTA